MIYKWSLTLKPFYCTCYKLKAIYQHLEAKVKKFPQKRFSRKPFCFSTVVVVHVRKGARGYKFIRQSSKKKPYRVLFCII